MGDEDGEQRAGPYRWRKDADSHCTTTYLAEGPEGPVELELFPLIDRDEAGGERFTREMNVLITLLTGLHPAIRRAYAAGVHEGCGWVARARPVGEWLEGWRKAAPHPWAEVFAVVRQIGEVLVAVERVDVLPTLRSEDVHVGPDGAVQVELTADAAERMCRSGMLPYGVMFTSPEEVAGKPRTRGSLQFSLCELAWLTFHRQRPFAGESLLESMMAKVEGKWRDPPPATVLPPKVPLALVRGLALDPADRWPSIEALLASLAPRRGLFAWLRR